jgi:hypothetical protein
MINSGGASDAPIVNSETPVAHTSLPKQPLKKNTLVLFILLVTLITTVTIAVVLFRNSQSQKSDNKTSPSSQTPPVDLKAEYQNPFDKSAQYENPFENLK